MRCAVLAVPVVPDVADELDAGALGDCPDGAATYSDPPQARTVRITSDAMAVIAAVRILDGEFITFLPSFLQSNSRSLASYYGVNSPADCQRR